MSAVKRKPEADQAVDVAIGDIAGVINAIKLLSQLDKFRSCLKSYYCM